MLNLACSGGTAVYKWQESQKDTRIELLLGLYDAAVTRLERVLTMLAHGLSVSAAALLLEAQYAVYAVVEGCEDVTADVDRNLAMLHEYCLYCLGIPTAESVGSALRTLITLREGFQGIR